MRKLISITALLVLFGGLAAANPDINVQLMETEPSPMQIGEYADVQFKVSNTGDDAENVSVELMEEYPFSVDSDEKDSWVIRDFDQGDGYSFRVPVLVSPAAVQNDETLEVKVSRNGNSRNFNLPVEVKADDDGLVVDKVEFPDRVGSGTSSTMNVTLENTANGHFRNVDVSLGLNEIPMVVSGTTRQRVDSIAPDEKRILQFEMQVDESASNGVYSIPITLEYENEAGAPQSKTQNTGVVIGGEPQIETALNEAGDIAAGSSGTTTYRFVNRGEGTAKFVQVEFQEGENFTILSGDSVYLGDMNPDDYQTAEIEIHTDPGTDSVSVPVELSYRENGEELTETQEVEVNVLTEEETQLYSSGSSSGIGTVLVLAVILVAGAGIYYWRKRR